MFIASGISTGAPISFWEIPFVFSLFTAEIELSRNTVMDNSQKDTDNPTSGQRMSNVDQLEDDAVPEASGGQAYPRFSRDAKDDEKTYLDFLDEMPLYVEENGEKLNLKLDNIDILLLHSDEEKDTANQIKQELSNVSFMIKRKPCKPNVSLFGEVDIRAHDSLDMVFNRALFIYMLVTEKFCKYQLPHGHACVMEDLKNYSNRVVALHLCSRDKRKYKLPMLMNHNIREIVYSLNITTTNNDTIKQWLENESKEYLKRKRELKSRRFRYYEELKKEEKERGQKSFPSPPSKFSSGPFLAQLQEKGQKSFPSLPSKFSSGSSLAQLQLSEEINPSEESSSEEDSDYMLCKCKSLQELNVSEDDNDSQASFKYE